MLNQPTSSQANERQKESEKWAKHFLDARKKGLKFIDNKIEILESDETEAATFEIKKVKPVDGQTWELRKDGWLQERFFSKKNALGYVYTEVWDDLKHIKK